MLRPVLKRRGAIRFSCDKTAVCSGRSAKCPFWAGLHPWTDQQSGFITTYHMDRRPRIDPTGGSHFFGFRQHWYTRVGETPIFYKEEGFQASPIAVTVHNDAKIKLGEVTDTLNSDGDVLLAAMLVSITSSSRIATQPLMSTPTEPQQRATTANLRAASPQLSNALKSQRLIHPSVKRAIQNCAPPFPAWPGKSGNT